LRIPIGSINYTTIVGQLQQFPIGRTNSGGRAGGTVEVVVTNPLPGQPSVVQAKCANDCPPGDVQLLKVDDGSYVALSPNAAVKTSETTTRQVSKKESIKPKTDEDIWPCTVCFLYSRIKPNTENLTDNGAASGNETSWDFVRGYSTSNTQSFAYVARQRFDELGDYYTAQDAIDNKLKPDRLIVPIGGNGAGKDNLVAASGSPDAVTVWWYIGQLGIENATGLVEAGDGQIFKALGTSTFPGNQNTEQGPGFCMEMYRQGSISVSLYPIQQFGLDPLTQHLKSSFFALGGRIGYWGNIYSWHGMQDYTTGGSRRTFLYREYWSGIQGVPAYPTETIQTPTSLPPDHVLTINPWTLENAAWYKYGWEYPNNKIACMSAGAIVATTSAITSSFACGDTVAGDKWYWSGGIGSSAGALDKRANYSSARGMFVCWQGHKDNIGLAHNFWEAFRIYWEIPGTVTKLRSCNLYGCELPGGGGSYPPSPPADAQRFVSESHGRKAEIWLKIHKEDLEPVEIKLPFEFAAVIERITVLGGGSLNTGTAFEAGKNQSRFLTYGKFSQFGGGQFDPYSLENPHATLSVDSEFAYIDILYGAQRLWEEPLTLPVKPRLANMGFGSARTGIGSQYGSDFNIERRPALNPVDTSFSNINVRISGATFHTTPDTHPRIVKDCFTCCQSYKVRLPTKDNPLATIVASQKYKNGENITLTVANPDNEFNNKFLIADYRTENLLNDYLTPNYVQKVHPQPHYATFGGLPVLMQIIDYTPQNVGQLAPTFYKNQSDWSVMDWIHYQLQESPRRYNPLLTVLPPGVVTRQNERVATIFDLDNKFDRQGRAERIMPSAAFGNSTSTAPTYRVYNSTAYFPLFVSFKEQLIGNGLIENNKLTKWFRINTSSFPVFGQLKRNPL